jgi:ribosomal protein S18 acetylase RimI-like enzyme
MRIRPCLLADAPAVAGLATELGYPTDAAQARVRLEWLLGRGEDAVLVAEEENGGAVVGWVHVREARSLESEPVAEIAGLVVTAARRGQGFGTALVQAGLAWAAERGLPTVRVRSNVVRADTHRWYQAAGFEVIKTQRVFSRPSRRS